jgi:hypothetical protein
VTTLTPTTATWVRLVPSASSEVPSQTHSPLVTTQGSYYSSYGWMTLLTVVNHTSGVLELRLESSLLLHTIERRYNLSVQYIGSPSGTD